MVECRKDIKENYPALRWLFAKISSLESRCTEMGCIIFVQAKATTQNPNLEYVYRSLWSIIYAYYPYIVEVMFLCAEGN